MDVDMDVDVNVDVDVRVGMDALLYVVRVHVIELLQASEQIRCPMLNSSGGCIDDADETTQGNKT